MGLWLLWLIVAGMLIIVEMLTLTFYLLWLAIGALCAMIVDFIAPGSFVLEVVVGCSAALLLTLFTKPLTARVRASHGFKDVVDELVGKQGIVLRKVTKDAPGIVKIGNETWSAQSDEALDKGECIIVVSRGSAMLHVKKQGGES